MQTSSTYSREFNNTAFAPLEAAYPTSPNPFDDPFFILQKNEPPQLHVESFEYMLPTTLPTVPHMRRRSSLPYSFAPSEEKQEHVKRQPVPLTEKAQSSADMNSEFRYSLLKLHDLGYMNDHSNIRLLRSFNNDVLKVIEHLEREKKNLELDRTLTRSIDEEPAMDEVPTKGEKRYLIKSNGRVRDLAMDLQVLSSEEKLIYNVHTSLFYSISITDRYNRKVLTIIKEGLHLHPTYIIKMNGRYVAQCQERFKFSRDNKKFNYRFEHGTTLKMVGTYNKDWIIRRAGTIVATISNKLGVQELTVQPNTSGSLHFLALLLIMLERRHTTLRT